MVVNVQRYSQKLYVDRHDIQHGTQMVCAVMTCAYKKGSHAGERTMKTPTFYLSNDLMISWILLHQHRVAAYFTLAFGVVIQLTRYAVSW